MGVVSLNKLAKKLDTTKMRESSFMMVLTGVGKYACRRKDGILSADRLSARLTCTGVCR